MTENNKADTFRAFKHHYMIFNLIINIVYWVKEILKTIFIWGFIGHVILALACCYSNFESVKQSSDLIVPLTVFGFSMLYLFE